MKLFSCDACKQVLFFENLWCNQCGRAVAYLPGHHVVSSLDPGAVPSEDTSSTPMVFRALAPRAGGSRHRLCATRISHGLCNWAVPDEWTDALCLACGLNEIIPNLSDPERLEEWERLELAKRRLLYTLLELGLGFQPKEGARVPLRFALKADEGGCRAFTGHSGGLITINTAEANDAIRAKLRQELGETYRTPLGHFRHESGHYFWDQLIADTPWMSPFRDEFGDERESYDEARQRHYDSGAPPDWQESHVSAYASMHPFEDWAETFAHYLHIVDTLDTARSHGMSLDPHPETVGALTPLNSARIDLDEFRTLIDAWMPLTLAVNSLNRSMGLQDLYPFVLSERVITKLRFVHEVVRTHTRA